MANPFFQGSRQPSINSNNNLSDIKNAYDIFSHSKNPMDAFMKMAQQNPQLQPMAQMIQNGANPETLVRQLCMQRGIDVNQLIGMFKGK